MTETTNLFSPATSWNQHPREPHTSATLSISEDVTTHIYIFNILNTYIFINLSCKLFIYLIYLSYKFIYLFIIFCRSSSAVRRPLFHPLQSPAFLSEMVRSTTQHCLCWPRKFTVLTKKGTNLIVFMVNTNVNCRNCMLIRNIWCWTLDSKVEVSTSIYGGIGMPLVTHNQLLVIQSSSFAKSAGIESNVDQWTECWWTYFNVELSLIKLKSKVLPIALRTTKLNCKVECWSLSSQMLHSQVECCDLYFDFWRGWNSIHTCDGNRCTSPMRICLKLLRQCYKLNFY